MGRLIICGGCDREKLHKARGLCKPCYNHYWREKNPEYGKQYYQRNRGEILARQRRQYKEDPEKGKLACRKWRERNRDRVIIRGRQYRKDYPERAEAACRRWRQKNPQRVVFFSARRRARRRALPDTLTFKQIERLFLVNTCFYCGSDQNLELDHFVPVIAGGGFTRANIVLACRSCNSRKKGKLPEEVFVQLPLFEEESDENRRSLSN